MLFWTANSASLDGGKRDVQRGQHGWRAASKTSILIAIEGDDILGLMTPSRVWDRKPMPRRACGTDAATVLMDEGLAQSWPNTGNIWCGA